MNSVLMGLRIKEARKKKQLTQFQLGDLINKTESSIRKYEKGDVDIPNNVIMDLAKVLNVNETWLMGYDVSMSRLDENMYNNLVEQTVLENYFRKLGWECKLITFTDGLNCGECQTNQSMYEPEWVCKDEYKNNKENFKPFCEHCKVNDAYYLFFNGNASFKVSSDDYQALQTNIKNFVKDQLLLLFKKTTQSLFDDVNNN